MPVTNQPLKKIPHFYSDVNGVVFCFLNWFMHKTYFFLFTFTSNRNGRVYIFDFIYCVEEMPVTSVYSVCLVFPTEICRD